jgi:wyosine [tRNA(Phe)-imidazoG37] synthetase (radical SAM superfamily)
MFHGFYIDSGGQVHLCSWMNSSPIGYVTDGVEKIWHGEAAKTLRRSVLDGSFRYCRREVCPYLMNGTLPEIPEQTLKALTPDFPDDFWIAYDYQCNLSCPSCRRKAIIQAWPEVQKLFDDIYAELAPYLDGLRRLNITGHGDPFFSKNCMRILKNFRPKRPDAEIFFETNGTCFVPKVWEQIAHLSDFTIGMNVSIDSFNPHVYAKLRRGGNFRQLEKNLRFMSELRRKNAIDHLAAVLVVQDINFMEMPSFVQRCFDLGFDKVQLENIYSWGVMNEKEYFARDLLNPRHPQHEFFCELREEVLKDPRVVCWAGKTSRIPVEYFVTGQSRLAISEIAETDTVGAQADFSVLLTSIRNRDYIFVVDEAGDYRGMLTYQEVIGFIKKPEAVQKKAGDLCSKGPRILKETDLVRIFDRQAEFFPNHGAASPQTVFPVLSHGKLVAKLSVA